MGVLIVVNAPSNWPLRTPGVEVVAAKDYISSPRFSDVRGAKIFNLCRSYRYQSLGYYVSLLAEARGHKPMPSITTVQDLKSLAMMRLAADDLEDLIQTSLERISADAFVLSIYFGRNMAKRYERLSKRLFNLFPAPMLRAHFAREPLRGGGERGKPRAGAANGVHGRASKAGSSRGGAATQTERKWNLQNIAPISVNDIPSEHLEFVMQEAEQYFAGKRRTGRGARGAAEQPRYDLAILHNPDEASPPSDERAMQRFVRAARSLGMQPELIDKDDYGRLAEFDALFIRETTAVNHHTYRFARRAAAEGLVVIDDPESIVRCTNKVYLAEMLERHGIPHPRTLIVHKENIEDIPLYVGFPCVLKQPDSAFSRGVEKCEDPAALEERVHGLLERSDLIIAQEWLPSDFDWRVGVLAGRPLFSCRYHMARGHWQIVDNEHGVRPRYGRVESLPVEATPKRVLSAAVRAANVVGDGLYGVDVKQIGARAYVIEVNDNPNIDAGCEDRTLRGELYLRIMGEMLARIERLKKPRPGRPLRTRLSMDAHSPLLGSHAAIAHGAD